jgi:Predicted Fe-S oxidoreductases
MHEGEVMALRDLTLEITRKCPMSCKLCSSNGGEPCDPEFTFEELKSIVNQAKDLGVTEISLSGGEPFTSPFLIDLCQYITNLDIDAFIFTSGNCFSHNGAVSAISSDKFDELKESGAKKIVFSLHGSNSNIHDEMTRKRGSYDNLLKSINNAQKAGLELEVHVVPVKENYRDIPSIVALLEKIGVKYLHFLRFVPQGRGEVYSDELELNDMEQLELNVILNSVFSKSSITITIGAHFNHLEIETTGYCTAGTRKAVIRPDGYVFPCVGMKTVKKMLDNNNIKESGLESIVTNSYGFKLSKRALCNKNLNCCLAQKFLQLERIKKSSHITKDRTVTKTNQRKFPVH